MKTEIKKIQKEMRNNKLAKIEAIVEKYKMLASETKEVKSALEFLERDQSRTCDIVSLARTSFSNQLFGYVYKLYAGDKVLPEVFESELGFRSYIKGLLSEEDEKFLIDNFALFIDYILPKTELSSYGSVSEWSSLVPFILQNRFGKMFIAESDCGKEFAGLNNLEITVGEKGFESAAIRAFASDCTIHKYESEYLTNFWLDLPDSSFDIVVVNTIKGHIRMSENLFDSACRILKDGGELLLGIDKSAVLGRGTFNLPSLIIKNRMLKSAIQLPSENVVLHLVKDKQDTFTMYDASNFIKETDYRKEVDVNLFLEALESSKKSTSDTICCSYPYNMLKENMLLPAYYLHFPKSGVSLDSIATINEVPKVLRLDDSMLENGMPAIRKKDSDVFRLEDLGVFLDNAECLNKEIVSSDECSLIDKVVTINNLSKNFSKASLHIDSLPTINKDRYRLYYRVTGPAVVMTVSNIGLAVGYVTDKSSFLVPINLYVLKPRKGIDVRYLAAVLLSENISYQITSQSIDCDRLSFFDGPLPKGWNNIVFLENYSEKDQQNFIQQALTKDIVSQENYIAKQKESYKHSIRLKKHALIQDFSAVDSMFQSLKYRMTENKGLLKADELLSKVSSLTIADAMSYISEHLSIIGERIAHLSDEQDWGNCEAIDMKQFLEEYEKQHKGFAFKYTHSEDFIDYWLVSYTLNDKFLRKKGEPINPVWFPRKALTQIFDNIVANARVHGFKDKKRQDYVIRTSRDIDGPNMIIKISNNGAPMPSDLDTDLVFEYGYSSMLNQKGHGGIGGGEIAEIMQKYGGNVEIISTPKKRFTVTYVLTIPLASLY